MKKGNSDFLGENFHNNGTELDHTDKRSTHINFSLFDQRNSLEQYELRSFFDTIVDPARNYPPPDFLIKIFGVGAFPRGDLQALKAKAKMGKTTFAIMIIAILLGFKSAALARAKNKRYRVLHIDTEQHIRSVAWRQRMVYKLIEGDPDTPLEEYLTLSLREFTPTERRSMIKDAISFFKPDFVLIDGIYDLAKDGITDSEESKEVIAELMRIASMEDCAICCILHENKGKADNTMRGHMGTELTNKASEVYQVTRLKDLFTVSQTESRNAPTPDICFSIDSEGIPVLAEEANPSQGRSNLFMERVQIVRKFMQDKEAITYTELYEELMERFACSRSTSKREIAKMLDADILGKDINDKYIINRGKDDLF